MEHAGGPWHKCLVSDEEGEAHGGIVLARAIDDDVVVLAGIIPDVADERASEKGTGSWPGRTVMAPRDRLDGRLPARPLPSRAETRRCSYADGRRHQRRCSYRPARA